MGTFHRVVWISIIVFWSASMVGGCGGGGSSAEVDYTKIAKESKSGWLQAVSRNESIEYGLMSEDEFNSTTVGDHGLPVYLLSEESVEEYSAGNQLDLKFLKELKFLVRVNSQIRSMITVSTVSKKAVTFGESTIANQLNSIFSFLESKHVNVYQMKNMKLVCFIHGESKLSFLYEQENNWLIPLYLARKALSIGDTVPDESLLETENIMQKLKQYASKK